MRPIRSLSKQRGFISVALPVIASVAGSLLQSDASQSAANTQAGAANLASQNQLQMFNTNKADLQPWVTGGKNALAELQRLMGLGGTPAAGGGAGGTGVSGTAPAVTTTPTLAAQAASPVGSFDQWSATTMSPYAGMTWAQLFDADLSEMSGGLSQIPRIQLLDQARSQYAAAQTSGASGGAGVSAVADPPFGAGATTPSGTGASGTTTGATPAGAVNPTTGMLTRPFSMGPEWQDPSYQFRFDQGLNATKNMLSTQGGRQGGNALRALTDYGQGMASTEYGNAWNRWNTFMNNLFSRLNTLSSGGENAAGMTAGLGANAVQTAGNFSTDAANALAAGRIGSSNALTGGLGNIGQLLATMNTGSGGSQIGYQGNPNDLTDYAAMGWT